MHSDPVAALVLWLALILASAKLGADLAVRLRQPPVLGELLAGIAIGNLKLLGVHACDGLLTDPTIDLLARLGVIILLFEIGLESTVGQMLKVGLSALLVATTGVVASFALGFFVASAILPDAGIYTHVFLGATICATSVGITARVFKDLGASATTEARIVLGAAVIDDVQSLIVLAVVSGVVGAAGAGAGISPVAVAGAVGKATLFLVGALVLGVLLSHRLFRVAFKLRARGVLLATGLCVCFVLAWAADSIGLAPIIGAFAAGLILEDAHTREFTARGERGLDELVAPIATLLTPVFFVLMGAKTDLRVLADPSVIVLAVLLTLAATGGKVFAGLVALRPKGAGPLHRLIVGFGLIPRGEVELIFANAGLGLTVAGVPVVSQTSFSAVVVMVVLTTVLTPPLLRFAIQRANRAPGASPAATARS